MKRKNNTKRVIIGGLIVALIIGVGLVFMRKKSFIIGGSTTQAADLIIVNDTSDTVSSEYKRNEKTIDHVINPGEKVTGGMGLIRIFTAKKSGVYEVQYPYPRPAGKPGTVALSAIIQAARAESTTDNLYTKKGLIDDVAVSYEEVTVD